MVTTIIFIIVAVGLILWNGLNSSQLVANATISRMVLLGSILAAVVSGAMIFEALEPAVSSADGKLVAKGESVELGTVDNGVLVVECQMLEGVNQTGKKLHVRLEVAGDSGTQSLESHFQLGEDTRDMDNPKPAHMASNNALNGLGENTKVTLAKISKSDLVSVHVAFHPARFPYLWGLIALFVFVALAAAYEGAAPPGWQRTFLTVAIASVTAFAWSIQDGLTSADSGWTLWIRLAYSTAIGAVLGTLLPAITGKFLPELKAPAHADETPADSPS